MEELPRLADDGCPHHCEEEQFMTLEKLASRVAGEYVAGHTTGFSLYAGILGAIKEAVAEEREACAKIAEEFCEADFSGGSVVVRGKAVVDAIRARGKC